MGATYSVFEQSFPPRPTWSVNDIPDLTGKVILVTGAFSDISICVCACMLSVSSFEGGNAGVGKETVKVSIRPLYPTLGLIGIQQLLTHNAKVYLAARSAQKANEAITELENETGKLAIFLQLDLSDIPAVRKSAQEFLSYVPRFVPHCARLTIYMRFCRKENQLHVLINNA